MSIFLIHLRLELCVKLLCVSSQDGLVHLSVPRKDQVLLLTISGVLLSLLSKDSSGRDLAMFQTINFIVSLSLPLKVLIKVLFVFSLLQFIFLILFQYTPTTETYFCFFFAGTLSIYENLWLTAEYAEWQMREGCQLWMTFPQQHIA